MEATQASMNRWMDKDTVRIYTHTQDRVLFRCKKEWTSAICSNMNEPSEYYA